MSHLNQTPATDVAELVIDEGDADNADLTADPTFAISRGRADDLGVIVEQVPVSLQGLADLLRQAQAQPCPLTFAEYEALHCGCERYRNLVHGRDLKRQLDEAKRTPWYTCATFESYKRKKSELLQCTAIVCDADQPGTTREKLLAGLDALNVSYLIATSTSHGCGGQARFRVVLPLATPIPADRYRAAWESINAHLGGMLDPNAKDPTRLNYMPRIPTGATGHEIVVCDDRKWLDASALAEIEPPATDAAAAPGPAVADQVLTAISDDDWKLLNTALEFLRDKVPGNSEWSEVGYGLLSLQSTRPVRETWLDFSRKAVGYEPGAEVEWWDAHCRQSPRSDWRHVLKMAGNLGWKPTRVADVTAFPIVSAEPTPPVPVESTLQERGRGQPLSNVNNAITMLAANTGAHTGLLISHDEFSGKIFVKWPTDSAPDVLIDEDFTRVQLLLQRGGLVATTETTARAAVRYVARNNTFDAVRDWLDGLTWDGTRRLSSMMVRGFGTPAERYYIRAGRNMLLSMVARALDPGCQVDEAIVLEGPQGSLKSSALRIIGGEFFKELTAHPNSKDFEQQLQGVWLGEFAELNALRRPEDISRIKQFVTCREDHLRLPYDRVVSDLPRRTVLCGSTNEDCWLHDPTGGRRFIPVAVGTIDLDWLRSNRDQLFAEAVALYKTGRKWWIYPRAATLAEQEARAADDPWTDEVRRYLCGRPEVDASYILNHVLKIPTERQNKAHSTRAGMILKRLGCRAQAMRRVAGGRRSRPWIVPAELAGQPLGVAGPVQFPPIESHFDLVGGAL